MQVLSAVVNLDNLEINLDVEQAAMAAAQIALQGAQEYLDQTQALSAAALPILKL